MDAVPPVDVTPSDSSEDEEEEQYVTNGRGGQIFVQFRIALTLVQ
jgi:hypothetical protein